LSVSKDELGLVECKDETLDFFLIFYISWCSHHVLDRDAFNGHETLDINLLTLRCYFSLLLNHDEFNVEISYSKIN